MSMKLGWHSRGWLPHLEVGSQPQIVTFRLAESLPLEVMVEWAMEVEHLSDEERELKRRRRIERWLDAGRGPVWLADPEIAALVQNALLHFEGDRYRLHAWTIMPNHVHTMFTPAAGHSVADILHAWKGFTGRRANALLDRSGPFWQRDYFDRLVRDERHFANALAYIEANPVKAGLCLQPWDWPWGSARLRMTAQERGGLVPGFRASRGAG